MSDFIPPELLIDILKWLSVEDLGRFLIVCKSWYSLITSPTFISLHTQIQSSPTNSNNDNGLLLVRSCDNRSGAEIYSVRFENDTFQEYKSLHFPFKCLILHFRITGCFSGVLCLVDDIDSSKQTIILWNPSIRKSVTLPKPYGMFDHSIGFSFSAATNDFKVVRVFHLVIDGGFVDKVPPRIQVYDLSKGYWRHVDSKGFPYFVHPRSPQAYLNGVVHWTGSSNRHTRDAEHFNTIVSFDMGTEELGVIQMPDCVVQWRSTFIWRCPPAIRVSVLEESLSLITNLMFEGIEDVCDIWVMKEYGEPESWTKLFTIDFGGSLRGAFGFLRNGEVLLEDTTNRGLGFELASYDSISKQAKLLGISGDANEFYVDNFVETLAFLGVKGDTVQTH